MPTSREPVVVFGSLNIDLTVRVTRFPMPGETLAGSELVTTPGGKSSNQAAAVAALGTPVRLVGAVGDDANGRFLCSQAAAVGVDVSGVTSDTAHASGSAMILVDTTGENIIVVSPGANAAHDRQSVKASHFGGAAVVCLCLEVPIPAVRSAAEHGRAAGAQVVLNLSPYAEVPNALLELVDVLVVNRSEATLLLDADDGLDDWDRALGAFVGLGVDRVVVTLGAEGSVVLDATNLSPDRVTVVNPITVDVVDTTGCGDAYTGALAHRLASGSPLVEAARFATEASALAATAHGAQTSYTAFSHLNQSA